MTMRLIDADALKEELNSWAVDLTKSKFPHYIKDDADCIIDTAPTIDAMPVRHGRWVVIDAEEPRRYGCSECKRLSWNMENYCPNCGARMDAKE